MTDYPDRINIHEEIWSICAKLDIEPEAVMEIVVQPADLKATILKRRGDGAFYIDIDGSAASETREFKIRT